MRCFYHPEYVFPLPPEHPFPMDKFWRAEAMLREANHPAITIHSHAPASIEQLHRVHTPTYLASIRAGALVKADAVRLGLPASEALLHRSALEVGGTLAATQAALEDGLACNLAGGTHHAFADRGLGYCVLNDVAVAIRELHTTRPKLRIFVVDTDAHQGNGTHGIFAAEDRVFTYSIHVGKNYPAAKTPGDLDVPLPRYVEGADYLEQLESTLSPALDDFAPDFVFWIGGADLHIDDRFGQMRLTDEHFAARDHHILDLVTTRRVPTVVLYGGGYNRDRIKTARLHADTVLRAADHAQK
ncbi:histone deacetylase family protein [Actomonas aquatica]|uniref:Histone deacetylase n=1 Tax=Actomonas aquatica TaxID=2866162 RepID=A0ABZ1CAR9_9BACT|nr:histone deacetylase [Opitutus sp. WL0086]WRQ88561.1 histone deacetylase [Opitutus sp. WL0086]